MGNYKVYVHINKINGKRYYGITKQEPKKRWLNGNGYKPYKYKDGNKRGNDYFWNAINEYGWNEGFEHIIIAKGLSEDEAKWLEIELIKEFDTINRNKGYNITNGGESTNGYKHTEEWKQKMSKKMSGENNPFYGKHLSEEAKNKISEAGKGRKHSEETKKKLSEMSKGREFSEKTRQKLSESHKGKTINEETRQKLSESHKGYKWSEEQRRKMSESRKGVSNSGKKVYVIELDKEFESVSKCAKFLKCSSVSCVSNVLNSRAKTCKGYHIIYAKDRELEEK